MSVKYLSLQFISTGTEFTVIENKQIIYKEQLQDNNIINNGNTYNLQLINFEIILNKIRELKQEYNFNEVYAILPSVGNGIKYNIDEVQQKIINKDLAILYTTSENGYKYFSLVNKEILHILLVNHIIVTTRYISTIRFILEHRLSCIMDYSYEKFIYAFTDITGEVKYIDIPDLNVKTLIEKEYRIINQSGKATGIKDTIINVKSGKYSTTLNEILHKKFSEISNSIPEHITDIHIFSEFFQINWAKYFKNANLYKLDFNRAVYPALVYTPKQKKKYTTLIASILLLLVVGSAATYYGINYLTNTSYDNTKALEETAQTMNEDYSSQMLKAVTDSMVEQGISARKTLYGQDENGRPTITLYLSKEFALTNFKESIKRKGYNYTVLSNEGYNVHVLISEKD